MTKGEVIMSSLTMCAIIIGPILAIQVQKFIEHLTRKKEDKRRLFMTLLATRDRTLAPEHVQSLNMIHVVFSSKKDKDLAVVEAWELYHDHLANRTERPIPQEDGTISESDQMKFENRINEWAKKSDELLWAMLRKMAVSLGYHFPDLFIQKGAYTPQWHGDLEQYQMTILKGLADIMLGIRAFPMNVTAFPVNEESNKALMDFLQGNQPLTIRIDSKSKSIDDHIKENTSQET